MAEPSRCIMDWLQRNFKPEDLVWIDEGGLTLEGTTTLFGEPSKGYYEIGGEPEEKAASISLIEKLKRVDEPLSIEDRRLLLAEIEQLKSEARCEAARRAFNAIAQHTREVHLVLDWDWVEEWIKKQAF